MLELLAQAVTLDGPETTALAWDAILSLALVSLATYVVNQGRKNEKVSDLVTSKLALGTERVRGYLGVVDQVTDGISAAEIKTVVDLLQAKAGQIIKKGGE